MKRVILLVIFSILFTFSVDVVHAANYEELYLKIAPEGKIIINAKEPSTINTASKYVSLFIEDYLEENEFKVMCYELSECLLVYDECDTLSQCQSVGYKVDIIYDNSNYNELIYNDFLSIIKELQDVAIKIQDSSILYMILADDLEIINYYQNNTTDIMDFKVSNKAKEILNKYNFNFYTNRNVSCSGEYCFAKENLDEIVLYTDDFIYGTTELGIYYVNAIHLPNDKNYSEEEMLSMLQKKIGNDITIKYYNSKDILNKAYYSYLDYFDMIYKNTYVLNINGADHLFMVILDNEEKTYTVSFNANGGTGNMDNIKNVYLSYDVPENQFIAPEGMKFKGWSTTTNDEIVSNINVKEDITLYAIWEEIEKVKENEEYTYNVLLNSKNFNENNFERFEIIVDADYLLFKSLSIETLNLEKEIDYIVSEGSTIITFTKKGLDKLNMLSSGKYNIKINYSNNQTINTDLVINSKNISVPKTFDNIYYNLFMFIISSLCVVSNIIIAKRKRN